MNRLYRRLKVALTGRDVVALADLVRSHPDAHEGCDRRDTPVAMIAAAGLDLLEAAFAAGLSPDAGQRDGDLQTFLQHAAADGDAPTVALCIKYGADLEKRNSHGETALGYACSWGHLAVVRLLVDAGVDVNALEHDPEDDLRNTALDCCSRQPEIAAFLRSVGAKHAAELKDGAQQGG
jgi:ankyrin repeat protein